MSTHNCFAANQTDDGVQEEEIPGGVFYDVKIPDDQEQFGGSQAGGLHLFDRVVSVCASLLKAIMFTGVCTQIMLLSLTIV